MKPKDQIHFVPRIDLRSVQDAYDLIKNDIVHTDIVSSPELNLWLGHKVYFKLENQQTTGSFKFRGALYSVLKLKDNLPENIVTYGTGNHAVGLAWAASKFLNIGITAFLTDFTSAIKQKLATEYGAKVILTKTREEAEQKSKAASKIPGTVLLPPSDGDDIIAGAGTVLLEVLKDIQIEHFDAVFLPIGGGSIASGTVVVAKALSPDTQLYGAEPKSGNDAAISYRTKKIFRFATSPETLADGAKTPGISERVFQYIQDLNGIYEISEREIGYWTVWLTKIFEQKFEPTASLSMSAAFRWLKEQKETKTILVIITGQNINADVYDELLAKNYLDIEPDEFDYEW